MKDLKKKAIEELKEIRETGVYNMMNRNKVLQYANDNQYFNLICYCENDKKKYLDLLKQI